MKNFHWQQIRKAGTSVLLLTQSLFHQILVTYRITDLAQTKENMRLQFS
jgi:hypothetical protein